LKGGLNGLLKVVTGNQLALGDKNLSSRNRIIKGFAKRKGKVKKGTHLYAKVRGCLD